MIRRFVLATRNAKKVREMSPLLVPYAFELLGLDQYPLAEEVEETGQTFAANAAIKAIHAARATGEWAIADDSGLMVDALGGRPGVYSARYAGPGCTDADNNSKLLAELSGIPESQRGAKFVCHLVVADPCGVVRLDVEAACCGRIITDRRGSEGFGYDPLFFVPEYHCTFGELSLLVKSQLSHRARAFQQLIPQLLKL